MQFQNGNINVQFISDKKIFGVSVSSDTLGQRANIIRYGVLGSVEDLIQEIKNGKEIEFKLEALTKTRLRTTMFCEKLSLGVDLAIDGFDTHQYLNTLKFMPITKNNQMNLFKLNKKQGKAQYIEYLGQVIQVVGKSLGVTITQDHFNIYTEIFN